MAEEFLTKEITAGIKSMKSLESMESSKKELGEGH